MLGILASSAGAVALQGHRSLASETEPQRKALKPGAMDVVVVESCINLYCQAVTGENSEVLLSCFDQDGELLLDGIKTPVKGTAALRAWHKNRIEQQKSQGLLYRRKVLSPVVDMSGNKAGYRGYFSSDWLRYEDNRVWMENGLLTASLVLEKDGTWKISSLHEEIWYGVPANEHNLGANGKEALEKIGRKPDAR